ncbi:MAG: CCA tRNA nucleotidyltransferase [Halobacteriaceae archaeon]
MTGGDGFEDVVATIRERVTPDADEEALLASVVETVTDRAAAAIADRDVDADVVHVGSTARGTWVSGDRDVDVFVRFAPDTDRETLETAGLAIGRAVLPEGQEEYAEHPYVSGELEGVAIDLVPCYRVEDATDIRSSVDRTPFHDQYLTARLDAETRAAVRVTKQFLTAIGAYGSDLRTQGFSGYLTELLVLEYGDFPAFIDAATEWTPPVRIDPVGHGATDFDAPLVVIDPTDPGRNVAAVVSPENVARVQHYARSLQADPRVGVFEPPTPDPIDPATLETHLERRATTPLAVTFTAPDIVEDQLYPQLHRSLAGVVQGLEGQGFSVLRSATWAQDRGVLFVEPVVDALPAVERHEGPPVHVAEHATRFHDTYADDDGVYGPFIDGDRYVVERPREVRTAAAFLEEELLTVSLGTHVESAIEDGYDVLVGEAVTGLLPEFGVELARYFAPRP